MIRMILVAFIILVTQVTAVLAQSPFVVGAEWIHNPWVSNPIPDQEWTNMQAFGLQRGTYFQEPLDVNLANQTLNTAQARGIQVTFSRANRFMNITGGWRWMYHPEFDQHFNQTGLAGERFLDQNAEIDWSDQNQVFNCRRARVGIDNPGNLSQNLLRQNEQNEYICWTPNQDICHHGAIHVRLRLRLTSVQMGTENVVRVTVWNGTTPVINNVWVTTNSPKRTPESDQTLPRLGDNTEYGEVYVGSFTKGQGDNEPVNVEVYWPATVDVHLDYVAFDNPAAHNLFGGGT